MKRNFVIILILILFSSCFVSKSKKIKTSNNENDYVKYNVFYHAALDLYNSGNDSLAFISLDTCRLIYPENANIYYFASKLLMKNSHYLQALEFSKKAVDLDAQNSYYYHNLFDNYYFLFDTISCISMINNSLSKFTDNVDMFDNFFEFAILYAEKDLVLKVSDKLINIAPDIEKQLYKKYDFLFFNSYYAEALQVLEQISEVTINYDLLFYNYAFCNIHLGNNLESFKYINKAISLNDNSFTYYLLAATVSAHLKKYDLAYNYLLSAYNLSYSEPDLLLNLSKIFFNDYRDKFTDNQILKLFNLLHSNFADNYNVNLFVWLNLPACSNFLAVDYIKNLLDISVSKFDDCVFALSFIEFFNDYQSLYKYSDLCVTSYPSSYIFYYYKFLAAYSLNDINSLEEIYEFCKMYELYFEGAKYLNKFLECLKANKFSYDIVSDIINNKFDNSLVRYNVTKYLILYSTDNKLINLALNKYSSFVKDEFYYEISAYFNLQNNNLDDFNSNIKFLEENFCKSSFYYELLGDYNLKILNNESKADEYWNIAYKMTPYNTNLQKKISN